MNPTVAELPSRQRASGNCYELGDVMQDVIADRRQTTRTCCSCCKQAGSVSIASAADHRLTTSAFDVVTELNISSPGPLLVRVCSWDTLAQIILPVDAPKRCAPGRGLVTLSGDAPKRCAPEKGIEPSPQPTWLELSVLYQLLCGTRQ